VNKLWLPIAALGLIAIVSAAFSAPVCAQATPTATPTPTPVPVAGSSPWTPGAEYYENKSLIDDFFAGIVEWLDDAEEKLAELDELVGDVVALAAGDGIIVNGNAFSIDAMIDEIETSLSFALIWRCYADSPVVDTVLIFFAWMLIVSLIRFIILLVPYIQNLVDFVWGKFVDLWNSIPFIN